MTKLILFLFLLTFAFGFTFIEQNVATSNNDWKILKEKNYSIKYPSDWDLNQTGEVAFAILSPLESSEDKFRENVNLLIQDLSGQGIDLNKYTEISEDQIKTMLKNGVFIDSKRIKKGTTEYQKIIYTGDFGVYNLKFEQYYWVINEKAYVLTFTCEQNKFADFKKTGEKILNSFILQK